MKFLKALYLFLPTSSGRTGAVALGIILAQRNPCLKGSRTPLALTHTDPSTPDWLVDLERNHGIWYFIKE